MKKYHLGLYEKSMPEHLTIGEKLVEAGRARYDYLELSIDESDKKLARLDYTERELLALRREQEKSGVPILSICLSGHRRYPLGDPDEAVRQTGMEIMDKSITFAAKIGARIIQLAGYDVYYKPSTDETRALFARNLRRAAELAAVSGVTLAFETMETEFMNTVTKAMYWVDIVSSPWLQVYPDLGNITNAAVSCGGRVEADIGSGRGHLSAMHLKETVPGVFREVPYGSGHVDFAAGTAKAYELGVRLFVGEFWYNGENSWRETLAANNVFLRNVLEVAAELLPGEQTAVEDQSFR